MPCYLPHGSCFSCGCTAFARPRLSVKKKRILQKERRGDVCCNEQLFCFSLNWCWNWRCLGWNEHICRVLPILPGNVNSNSCFRWLSTWLLLPSYIKKKTFGPEYKSSCGVEGPTMFSLVTLGLVTIPNWINI
jgi:hypothetical protein